MKNMCVCVPSSWPFKATALAAACLALGATLSSQDKEKEDDEEEVFELSPFTVDGSSGTGYRATSVLSGTRISATLKDVGSAIGATVGGAQDVRFLRSLVSEGILPSSASFTPEGLFSEHDLPIGGAAQDGWLFDLAAQASSFESQAQPETDYLAQVGFVSGIDAATFKPKPLNLVAVVDKSGSMNGEPLSLVRKSLRQIVKQLGSDDQLSIVLYGSDTHLYLPATRVTSDTRGRILSAIDAIRSQGSTAMEAGLSLGFEAARHTAERFNGNTRVMLFTDERPNVGRTDAAGFMAMAEAASEDGIGLTTIGVGVHFGADLAERISAVRGGNLFYFDTEESMKETFQKEFDTMVLELAYDMELLVSPAPGFAITGLYGIPGDAVTCGEGGSIRLEVATIFASRSKGAIYLGFGNSDPNHNTMRTNESPIATASVRYTQADNGMIRTASLPIHLSDTSKSGEGLVKGRYLVDHYASMKLAILLYESGEYAEAARVANRFAATEPPLADRKLNDEKELAENIAKLISEDCQARGISLRSPKASPHREQSESLFGEWIEEKSGLLAEEREVLAFNDSGKAELFRSSPENPLLYVDDSAFEASRKKIVFADWGRTFRYKITDSKLTLIDGERITTYERNQSPTLPETASQLETLQREVSGLPETLESEVISLR